MKSLLAARRHPFVVSVVFAAVSAAFVFRAELAHAALVFVSGVVAWRLLLARAGVRRRRRSGPSWLAAWVEATSLAWIAAHVGRQPRDRTLRHAPATPIGSLRPRYYGRAADAPPAIDAGPGDEIPF